MAASRNAPWWLALIAFAEASFFPIPPDAMLVPMALARPRAAWRFAAICTVASVAGGALGYLIGFAVFDQFARPILSIYGYGAAYAAFRRSSRIRPVDRAGQRPDADPVQDRDDRGGRGQFDFWLFMVASILTRGARFFLVATLLHYFGDAVRDFIERRLTLVTSAIAAGIVGGFLALKLL